MPYAAGICEQRNLRSSRILEMASVASAVLENMKEEVMCPICLELLVEPQSLDCGHSFCSACITGNYKSSVAKNVESRCPVCRISYQLESLRPNRHVANIIERIKELQLNSEEEQKVDLCAQHQEKLLLFCKEDGKLICWLCERSQKHRGHHTFLVEDVVQEYQEKLQEALKKLMKEQEESEKLKAGVQEEITSWKDQIQSERLAIEAEFQQLKDILDSMEQDELQKLKEEEEHILNSLTESESQLTQQSQLLQNLVSEAKIYLMRPSIEMLQDVNDIIDRTETFTLQKPKTFLQEQRKPFEAQYLKKWMQNYKELTDAEHYWAHVTLTPSNNPNIVISENKRRLEYIKLPHENNSGSMFLISLPPVVTRPYPKGILGHPAFTSGKNYWEVDVSEKTAWTLGVYQPKLGPTQTPLFPQQGSKYKPVRGYWVIGLRGQSHVFYEEKPIFETLTTPSCRIGVFLDYEAGTVSFFSVIHPIYLIYRFSGCIFSDKVYPYFNPMQCQIPMTLC
ncbi:tripartite motif-containing protein 5-like isoform X2 [Ochotona curzoniae]|uniref:tripartite motif-containing protein 5-like isoform X2 n=1 Tax=Ochotona curzoniae TaxID=130825 RepID=UPI001B346E64|nr:tripartite motif-containing protein 5-like isoform X2 [Ochotona curzoniae]